MSRWIKELLRAAGINTNDFGPGSVRAAAVSKADQQGATLDTIMKSAGWTQPSTFTKFYKKTVLPQQDLRDFILPK